jgi:hypothetical protein
MKVLEQIKKANKTYINHTIECGKLLSMLVEFLPESDENEYAIFMQAGDGLVVNDVFGNNVPVSAVLQYMNKNKRMTEDEYLNSRI